MKCWFQNSCILPSNRVRIIELHPKLRICGPEPPASSQVQHDQREEECLSAGNSEASLFLTRFKTLASSLQSGSYGLITLISASTTRSRRPRGMLEQGGSEKSFNWKHQSLPSDFWKTVFWYFSFKWSFPTFLTATQLHFIWSKYSSYTKKTHPPEVKHGLETH